MNICVKEHFDRSNATTVVDMENRNLHHIYNIYVEKSTSLGQMPQSLGVFVDMKKQEVHIYTCVLLKY